MENSIIFALTGSSGSGKTTFSNMLYSCLSETCNYAKVYTTREPRQDDAVRTSFLFLSEDEFTHLDNSNYFICQTSFCGKQYGIAKNEIIDSIDTGKDIILDSIMHPSDLRKLGKNVVIVYLTTSTNKELYQRIITRNPNMSKDELQLRIENIDSKLKVANSCDYVVNTDASRGYDKILAELLEIFRSVKQSYIKENNVRPIALNKFRVFNSKFPNDLITFNQDL